MNDQTPRMADGPSFSDDGSSESDGVGIDELSRPEPGQPGETGEDRPATDNSASGIDDDDGRAMETLVSEWSNGTDWQENLAHGRSFVERFGDDAARQLLNDYGLGDHAAIIRAAAKAGRHIADLEREIAELRGEAPLRAQGNGAPAVLSDARRRELEEEHRKLRGAKDYWADGLKHRRVRDIMEALYGTKPIPVHGARGDAGGP